MPKLTLWHASDSEFTFPDHTAADTARKARTKQDRRAENGALGLWTSRVEAAGTVFGAHMYRIEVEAPETAIGRLTVSELRYIHERYEGEPERYERQRQSYIGAGILLLDLVESSGQVHQSIILDYSIIQSFTKV